MVSASGSLGRTDPRLRGGRSTRSRCLLFTGKIRGFDRGRENRLTSAVYLYVLLERKLELRVLDQVSFARIGGDRKITVHLKHTEHNVQPRAIPEGNLKLISPAKGVSLLDRVLVVRLNRDLELGNQSVTHHLAADFSTNLVRPGNLCAVGRSQFHSCVCWRTRLAPTGARHPIFAIGNEGAAFLCSGPDGTRGIHFRTVSGDQRVGSVHVG